jgi:hypothetical protein
VLADSLDALFGGVGDLGQGGRGPVGELQVLEVGPQLLDRVELEGVGGQPLDGQPVALAVEEGAHAGAPVRAQPVPEQDHPLAAVEGPSWSSTAMRLSVL